MPETEKKRVERILQENQKLNFVQRILNPHEYPDIYLPNSDRPSTHLMSWAETGSGKNKQYWVYPTVIYDQQSGRLVPLSDDSAWHHAKLSGERIRFKTPEEADWFSKNYKMYWENPER
ncbi:MAG: hypothetical protein BV459_03820 [Thermoplasmata archaeon M11B2D]|nr:MAG: hypothetical protein BV459_03820 [Thermoplasmata archaeon M11B2D]